MLESSSLTLAAANLTGINIVWEFLQKGGVFMIPLGITSVAGMMAILYKLLSLSNRRVIPSTLAREVAQFPQRIVTDKVEPILKEFAKGASTLARLSAIVVLFFFGCFPFAGREAP